MGQIPLSDYQRLRAIWSTIVPHERNVLCWQVWTGLPVVINRNLVTSFSFHLKPYLQQAHWGKFQILPPQALWEESLTITSDTVTLSLTSIGRETVLESLRLHDGHLGKLLWEDCLTDSQRDLLFGALKADSVNAWFAVPGYSVSHMMDEDIDRKLDLDTLYKWGLLHLELSTARHEYKEKGRRGTFIEIICHALVGLTDAGRGLLENIDVPAFYR